MSLHPWRFSNGNIVNVRHPETAWKEMCGLWEKNCSLMTEPQKSTESVVNIWEQLLTSQQSGIKLWLREVWIAITTLLTHLLFSIVDPRICTLTPNGHLELGALSAPRGSYSSSERRSFTMESRKSSVMSLGKSSLERRSLSLVLYHTVIPQTVVHTRKHNFSAHSQQIMCTLWFTLPPSTFQPFLLWLYELFAALYNDKYVFLFSRSPWFQVYI